MEAAGRGSTTSVTIHKSDLDDGCFLSRQEEPPDLVMVSGLYSSVNMEIEVTGVVKTKQDHGKESGY